ncbi:MAG: AraC family transcriptional regulator [Woeseiaceae bacterium]|nr:AraC family transcriptional regulator [Woeseiaceae bacterium]
MELFLQPKTDFSVASEVQSLLQKHMHDGLPTAAIVAENAPDPTDLDEKTEDEGSSFQQIKDLIRRDRAIYLLTSRCLAVGEIAEKVGFSDSAVFARAFKSWTGLSPRDYTELASLDSRYYTKKYIKNDTIGSTLNLCIKS